MAELAYKPDGETLRQFMLSPARVRGLRGPWGSGKSACCCVELMRLALGQAHGPDGKRRSRAVVIRNTGPELRTTTIKTWLDWFPEGVWGKFNWQPPFTHHIKAGDLDFEVIFLALDREDDVKKLLSLEATFAWVNEAREVPKAVVDAVSGRVGRFPSMRDGGPTRYGVIMDTNAMDPDHWWPILAGEMPPPDDMTEEEILTLVKPADWQFFCQPPAMVEDRDGEGKLIGYALNEAAENVRHLVPGYYPNLLAGKAKAWIDRYVLNRLIVLTDAKAVYPSFREDLHVAREPLPIVKGHPVRIGMDFGLTPAVVFAQNVRGRWLIQRELIAHDMGVDRFAPDIKRLLDLIYPECDTAAITGDPAGDIRAQTDETTPFMILRAHGLEARPAPTNDFQLRVESVEATLNRLVEGKPGIIVDPSCRHLIKAMAGGYHYKKIQATSGAGVRYADRPDKNMSSHIAEALQYLLLGAGEGRALTRRTMHTRPRTVAPKPRTVFERIAGGRR